MIKEDEVKPPHKNKNSKSKKPRIKQSDKGLVIPRAVMRRVFYNVYDQPIYMRITRCAEDAFDMIHSATENHTVGVLSDANLISRFSGRVTVLPKDIFLARELRRLDDKIYYHYYRYKS